MKAVIIDGSNANDETGHRVLEALKARLAAGGHAVDHMVVRDMDIAQCAGHFLCWTRSPGVCKNDDDSRIIAKAAAGSDVVILLTRITFGGYSSTLKRAVDHMIPNVSPFFLKTDGETHHKKRYDTYPDLVAVGWTDEPHERSEAIFTHLAHRNALNWHAETCVTGVLTAHQSDEEVTDHIEQIIADLEQKRSSVPADLPPVEVRIEGERRIGRALLLIGSPRREKSTSNILGSYLFDQLPGETVETEKIHVHTAMASPDGKKKLLEAAQAADLVMLAFPLYVDSLPAPVIAALEDIADERADEPALGPIFGAIANCGFPESSHNAPALAICAEFADRAGFTWAGGLALGGGEAIAGVPFDKLKLPTKRIRSALESAANALAVGRPMPETAVEDMAKPIIPGPMYRAIGSHRWRKQAKKHGAKERMKDTPFA